MNVFFSYSFVMLLLTRFFKISLSSLTEETVLDIIVILFDVEPVTDMTTMPDVQISPALLSAIHFSTAKPYINE